LFFSLPQATSSYRKFFFLAGRDAFMIRDRPANFAGRSQKTYPFPPKYLDWV
jgi:hypothetical protein